jgi:hypothetical protein
MARTIALTLTDIWTVGLSWPGPVTLQLIADSLVDTAGAAVALSQILAICIAIGGLVRLSWMATIRCLELWSPAQAGRPLREDRGLLSE